MNGPPSSFSFSIGRTGWKHYRISAALFLKGKSLDEVFSFFEDPRNLFTITPPWLDFRMLYPERSETREGAEFDYTIRWLGIRVPWRSRIVNYYPPREFTDIQIKGPYVRWEHRHTFGEEKTGTLMQDQVDYTLPIVALPLHSVLIRGQLEKIFRYRAMQIAEWALGTLDYRRF